MRCDQLMHTPVRWVEVEDTVRTAARVMRDENVGFLVVRDKSGRIVGTLTDRDIALRLVADDHVPGMKVGTVMTRELVHCHPDDDMTVAETLMRQHRKARIVCTDVGGHAVGIISLADIARVERPQVVGELLREITTRESHA